MNKRIKRYLSLLLAVVMLLAYVPSASAASREAQEAADALHDLGLFNGTGTDENGNPIYELDRAPTRAESVTMLVRLLGKENEATSGTWNTPFTDVADWAKPYVGYAYANGLTNGVGTNTFGGSQTVTASQYLTFVLRALGYDSGTDFQWDKAWELSDKAGITKGEYGAGSAFTRGDVAIVSYRALSAKLKDGSRTLMDVVDSSIEHGTVYAVSSLDVSGKSVTATVNTINACTLKITFYDEDEMKTVATASVRVPANREMETFKTTVSASLPKYFVVEAVLTDAGGKQLCDPYKTMKYTKKYEEFEATTVNDFDGDDIVMNFDEDIKTNFAVLNDGAVRVDCADTVNACSADGNVLTFANANAQLDGIQEGTILALYVDDVAMMSVLVKSVSRSGNVVSVTADDDYEMQEMYQYIKVDVSETADEYYRTDDSGTIAYSEQGRGGVAFASAIYAAPHGGGTALYASLFDPIKVKSEDTLEGEVSYDLTDAVTLSAKVSAKVAYSLKVSYDVRLFGKDYYEIEYKAELSGKIGGSVKAKAGYNSTDNEIETFKLSPKDLTLELGKFYIPTPVPALSITAELQIPLKINVQGEVSWEGQFKLTSGFTCHQDAKGKYSDKFEDKTITTDTFKVSVEGSVSFGIHAAVGADFASVISAEVGAEAGIKVKIGMAKEFGSGLAFGKSEEKHYCAICLEGEAKLYFKADITFHLGFKIGKKLDIGIGNTWTIAEVVFLKRDFYYSVDLKLSGDPNYKGWGTKCPNRGYLVTVLAKGGDGKEIADLDVRIFGSDKNGATDDKLKTGGSVYLRPGTYTAYVTGSDGKEYTKAFTVAAKAQEVVVEVKGTLANSLSNKVLPVAPFEPNGYSVVEYDKNGNPIRETSQVIWDNSIAVYGFAIDYDNAERATRIRMYSVVVDCYEGTFSYDANGRLKKCDVVCRDFITGEIYDESPSTMEFRYNGSQLSVYGDYDSDIFSRSCIFRELLLKQSSIDTITYILRDSDDKVNLLREEFNSDGKLLARYEKRSYDDAERQSLQCEYNEAGQLISCTYYRISEFYMSLLGAVVNDTRFEYKYNENGAVATIIGRAESTSRYFGSYSGDLSDLNEKYTFIYGGNSRLQKIEIIAYGESILHSIQYDKDGHLILPSR